MLTTTSSRSHVGSFTILRVCNASKAYKSRCCLLNPGPVADVLSTLEWELQLSRWRVGAEKLNVHCGASSGSSPAASPAAPAADPSAAMMQAMFFQMMSQTMRQQNSAPSTSAAAPPSGSNGAPSNGAPSKGDANGMD